MTHKYKYAYGYSLPELISMANATETMRRKILFYVLSRDDLCKISLPTVDEVCFYKSSIDTKYPLCYEIWGATNWLNISIQSCEDKLRQNKNFNGWTHVHYINCCFVFSPNGRIHAYSLNTPGTFHTSTILV